MVFSGGFLFAFEDHLELVDSTERISRDDKRGAIDDKALPILERLNIDPGQWCREQRGLRQPIRITGRTGDGGHSEHFPSL